MPVKEYTSAVDRLLTLPAIFKGVDLTMRFGWSSQTASNYLGQWKRRGLVRSLGGRSDVHFNLLVQRDPDLERGLRSVLPAATKIGVDVMREAGWTTQVMTAPEVAVPADGPVYGIQDFSLQVRSPRWFDLVAPGCVDEGVGLRRLLPEWSLADMVARGQDRRIPIKKAWMLGPDDLDLEAARGAEGMAAALKAFGLSELDITDEGYAQLYDELQALRLGAPPAYPRMRG